MRIVLMPIFYFSDDAFSISCVNGMLDLAKGLMEQNPNCFVYLYLVSGLTAAEEKFQKKFGDMRSRITVRWYPPFYGKTNWIRDECFFHQDLYNLLSSRRGECVDVILNANTYCGYQLVGSVNDCGARTMKDSPIIIGWNNDFTHPIKDGQFRVDQMMEIQGTVMMLHNTFNQFLIPYEKELGLDSARKFLSHGVVKKIMDNAIVEPMGIDFTPIKEVVGSNHAKRDLTQVRFFFGGSLDQPKKRAPEMMEIVNDLYCMGLPVEFVISTQSKRSALAEHPILSEKFSTFVRVFDQCDRAKFIQNMAVGDVFFCFTDNESMGLAYFEMFYSGMIGVFLNRPWLKGLLPPKYPFIVDSFADARSTSRWIIENWNEARDMVNSCNVQEFLEDKFGYKNVARRWNSVVKPAVDALNSSRKFNGFVSEIVSNSLDKWDDEFDMDYAYEMVKKYSDKGIELNGRGDIMTKGFFRRSLLATGKLYDTCQSEKVIFRKVGSVCS